MTLEVDGYQMPGFIPASELIAAKRERRKPLESEVLVHDETPICCPDAMCGYSRPRYVVCDGCGATCIGCSHRPRARVRV